MRFWTILELSLLGNLATTAALPAANNKGTFKALYDFTSQATGEATLHKGDLVTVLQEDASGMSDGPGLAMIFLAALLNDLNRVVACSEA